MSAARCRPAVGGRSGLGADRCRQAGEIGGPVAVVGEGVPRAHDRSPGLGVRDVGGLAGVVERVDAIYDVAAAGNVEAGLGVEGVAVDRVVMGTVDQVHPALQVGVVAAVDLLPVIGEADVPGTAGGAVLDRVVVAAGAVEDVAAGVVGRCRGVVDHRVAAVSEPDPHAVVVGDVHARGRGGCGAV